MRSSTTSSSITPISRPSSPSKRRTRRPKSLGNHAARQRRSEEYVHTFEELRPVATGEIAPLSEILQLVQSLASERQLTPYTPRRSSAPSIEPSLSCQRRSPSWCPRSRTSVQAWTTSNLSSPPRTTTCTTAPRSTVRPTFDCSRGSLWFRGLLIIVAALARSLRTSHEGRIGVLESSHSGRVTHQTTRSNVIATTLLWLRIAPSW